MTLLEYLISKYLGPPTYEAGEGESQWNCPNCGHERFHTMPDKPQFKHRFKCWVCSFRGDTFDFLKEMHPDETFSDRQHRLHEIRREWEQRKDAEFSPILHRGRGGLVYVYQRDPTDDEVSADAREALSDLLDYCDEDRQVEQLDVAGMALGLCADYKLHPEGFGRMCSTEASWKREVEKHMEECEDPNCENMCCRRERGLPPLGPLPGYVPSRYRWNRRGG